MASQPPPDDGTPGSWPSVPDAKICSTVQKCVTLTDWWLERRDDKIFIAGLIHRPPRSRKGDLSAQGSKNSAVRVFSDAIGKMRDCTTVETVTGFMVWTMGKLNKSRMLENGFSEELCEAFMHGFPLQWKQMIDSNTGFRDEHPESPTNSADEALVQHYLEEFMSDSFVSTHGLFAGHRSFSSFQNLASADLGEPRTPKGRTTSVNLETENAPEVPAPGMTPTSGAVRASEKNETRTLRSGRVLREPVIGGKKSESRQRKASANKQLKNKEATPTTDPACNENGRSAAGIVAEEKLQSHDEGKRKCKKRRRSSYRETKKLFWSFR